MQGSDPDVNKAMEGGAMDEVADLFSAKPHPVVTHMTESEQLYHEAAIEVARARVRYAQEWAFARMSSSTDKQADMAATEKTGSEVDIRLAELKILERRLMVG